MVLKKKFIKKLFFFCFASLVETKFHCDLQEHMDVLKVKIEMPDTEIYGKDKMEPDGGTEEAAIS